jgi:AcrR family transcriptional regulator
MIKTARRLIGERGAAATTITAIQAHTPGPRRKRTSAAPGSLFYYFGTKERVLIEVLRTDVAERLQRLRARLAKVTSFDELTAALADGLDEFLTQDVRSHVVLTDLVGEALRHPQLAEAQAEVYADWRRQLTEMLDDLQRRRVLQASIPVAQLAELITAVAQGLAVQELTDPSWDRGPAVHAARELLRVIAAPQDSSCP